MGPDSQQLAAQRYHAASGGHYQHYAAPRSASVASGSPPRRRVVKALNEVDGMVYSLVFEGSLNKLSVKQLKRHLQDTTGLGVSRQILEYEGQVLSDLASCGSYGVTDGTLLTLRVKEDPYADVPAAAIPAPGVQPAQLPPPGAAVPPPYGLRTEPAAANREEAHLRRVMEQNNERLRQIQADEALLQEQEECLAREEAALGQHAPQQATQYAHPHEAQASVQRQQHPDLEQQLHVPQQEQPQQRAFSERRRSNSSGTYSNNPLTMEQLSLHNHGVHNEHDVTGDDLVIVVEELPSTEPCTLRPQPPPQTHAYPTHLRVAPSRDRSRHASPAPSYRSRSSAWLTQASEREFELDSMWQEQAARFDQQRAMNALQMSKLEQQLAEKEADLAQKGLQVQNEFAYTMQKRVIVDALLSKVA